MAERLSPWAERFQELHDLPGRPSIFTEDGLEHSGIAIEFPRRHPKFYLDPPSGTDAQTKPRTGVEYDRLFISEDYQESIFIGARTMELTWLNRFLFLSNQFGLESGGHLSQDNALEFVEAFKKKSIQVNEAGWFDFLQKHRWYDLAQASNEPDHRDGPWTVDNPKIWDNLRGSIELVDRILKALLNDRHSGLETILFGRLVYWKDIASHCDIDRPFEDAIVLVSPEMELKIAKADDTLPWQSEVSHLPEEQKIKALMIHEIMHAIVSVRYKLEGFPDGSDEPFIDFDAIAEVGSAMEHRIFGGDYVVLPDNSLPISIVLLEWPRHGASGIDNPNHPINQNDPVVVVKPLPALYISRMFSAEFWDNPFGPKKSDASTWHTDIFQSFKLNLTDINDLDRFDRAIVRAWTDKQQEQDLNRRGWFDICREHWGVTPWGYHLGFRQELDGFAVHFRKSDEFECYGTASLMLTTMDWKEKTKFFESMPNHNGVDNAWVWFTLGLLMLAAMPIRTAESGKDPDMDIDIPTLTYTPSRETQVERQKNKGWKAPEKFNFVAISARPLAISERPANALYDPFGPDDTESIAPEIPATQMEYLSLVDKILNHIKEKQAIVSAHWGYRIERCLRNLQAQREEIMVKYPQDHSVRWAKRWPFRMPEFDHNNLDWMQWNEEGQIWKHYPQILGSGNVIKGTPLISPSSSISSSGSGLQ
ncbi:hypothetical protein F5Y12DRAFT_718042 [Xylaria sp. FL1777]|nr:hypothetical protein F5Y12DRAFT_718042 [Xylaria sp. FL1777]